MAWASGGFAWAARCESHRACWTHSWIGRCRFLISSPDHSAAGSSSSSFLSPETRAHSFGRKVEILGGEGQVRHKMQLHPDSTPPPSPTLCLGSSLEAGQGGVYLLFSPGWCSPGRGTWPLLSRLCNAANNTHLLKKFISSEKFLRAQTAEPEPGLGLGLALLSWTHCGWFLTGKRDCKQSLPLGMVVVLK